MPILILLAVLLILAIVFGPLFMALLALVGSVFVTLWAAGIAGAAALLFIGCALCLLGWCVWWMFDHKAASAAWVAARERRLARHRPG